MRTCIQVKILSLVKLSLEGVVFPEIEVNLKVWLERDFEEEVSIALVDCAGDKALGPDDFNFIFVKVAWAIIKDDFCCIVSEFQQWGKLSKEINSTFLRLIPKVLNPMALKDFRPISLVGCIYKLLSKILANRLRRVLPCTISPSQGALVHKRQILDGILIANELIQSRREIGRKEQFLKLIWRQHIIMWIGSLHIICWGDLVLDLDGEGGSKSVSHLHPFSALVNGSPSWKFLASRGLR